MRGKPKIFISSNLLAGHSWIFIVAQAVVAILLGSFFLINEKIAMVVLALALGVMLLGCGIQQFSLVILFWSKRFNIGQFLYGLLLFGAGLFLIIDPLLGVLELMWLLGAWFLLHGIELLIAAVRTQTFSRTFRLMAGINAGLSILCGAIIFLSPLAGFKIINFLFAFYLIFYGIITLIVGVRLRDISCARH